MAVMSQSWRSSATASPSRPPNIGLDRTTAAETLDSHLWPDSDDRTRDAVDAISGDVRPACPRTRPTDLPQVTAALRPCRARARAHQRWVPSATPRRWAGDPRRRRHYGADEQACKPDPVPRRLAARGSATIHLGPPSPTGSSDLPAGSDGPPSNACAAPSRKPLGLAPGGVYRAAPVTRGAGGLLHHRFTLAPRFAAGGGLFSVALSRGSPRVAVDNHPALRSPDFPRRNPEVPTRPPGLLVRSDRLPRRPHQKRGGHTGNPLPAPATRCLAGRRGESYDPPW